MHRRERMDDVLQGVRYTVRSLRRASAFTAVIVLTLGVAIGATTAIASAVDAFILRPLPYRDLERLMHVSLTTPDLPTRKGNDDGVCSYLKLLLFWQTQTVFEQLALYSEAQFNISVGEGASLSARPASGLRGSICPRLVRTSHADEISQLPMIIPMYRLKRSFLTRSRNDNLAVIRQSLEALLM